MANGITEGEFQRMLDELRRWREANAIQLGDGIRRGEIRQGNPALPMDRLWYVDVWDDEYFDTIILLSDDTPEEMIKSLFLQRKRAYG
jgi:hypothetical protein